MTVEAEWVGVGISLLLAAGAAAWKLAKLRSEVIEDWADRVEISRAGLRLKTATALGALQVDIAELQGSVDSFDPLAVIVDPAAIKGQVKAVLRLFKVLDRLPRQYRLLLRLGPFLLGVALLFGVGVVLAFGHAAGLLAATWVQRVGWSVLAVSLALGLVGFGSYAYLQHALSIADTHSRDDHQSRGQRYAV